MSQKLIIANWKMNPQTQKEADKIFSGILLSAKNIKNTNVVVCPPSIFIGSLKKNNKILTGAQNVSGFSDGAYTGELSAKMLKDKNVSCVIVGHSESRATGETNELINQKINLLLKNKLQVVLCIGEKERDHNGFYLSFIKKQLHECLEGVSKSQIKNIVIAYEPIWAIGADALRQADVSEFVEMSIFIKKIIGDMYDVKTAHDICILYGGSVHPENAESFLSEGGAAGLLVGRDSLNVKKFSKILNCAEKIK
jgi:triosephosphate isomerase (TIM)